MSVRHKLTSILIPLCLLSFSAYSHEGPHEENSEQQKKTNNQPNGGYRLPVKSGNRNTLPRAPAEDRYSHRSRKNKTPTNPFSVGLFVSLDVPMINGANEPLSPSTQSQSETLHKSGDQHKAPDGHDHHHAILGRGAGFRCPTGSRCHGGEDHSAPTPDGSGGQVNSSSVLTPVATLKAGYAFSQEISLGLNISTDFSNGLKDPTIGPSLLFPIAERYKGMVSLLASVPLSTSSRENSKITTISGSINTLYTSQDNFFAGGGMFVSGSFYSAPINSQSSMPNTGGMGAVSSNRFAVSSTPHSHDEETNTQAANGSELPNPLELVRTGGSLFTGLMLSDRFSANVSLGLGTTYKDDESFGWLTDVTIGRLAYSANGFMGAIAFSFLSDPKGMDSIPIPSEPFIGLKIQYVFGSLSSLGIVGTDSLGN